MTCAGHIPHHCVVMSGIAAFLHLVERYCSAAGCAEATLSTRMLGDGKRLSAIRSGSDIGVRRLAEAVAWLSRNWPADLDWPADVVRPEPAEAAA